MKENDSKKIFWIRFTIYILFGGVIPIAFLIWRFNLFTRIDKISIGGWGILAILFAAFFVIKLMKQAKKGMPFSIVKQTINGYSKVIIPLLAVVLVLYFTKDFIDQITQFLIVLIISEMIAIPANPFPKWERDNGIQEQDNRFKKFCDYFWKSKKD